MCFASTLASRPPSFAFLDLRNEHRQQPSISYHSPTFTERIVGEALGILRGEATELSTIPTGQEVSELLRAALRGCAAEWAGEKRGSVGMPNNSGRSWKQNCLVAWKNSQRSYTHRDKRHHKLSSFRPKGVPNAGKHPGYPSRGSGDLRISRKDNALEEQRGHRAFVATLSQAMQ